MRVRMVVNHHSTSEAVTVLGCCTDIRNRVEGKYQAERHTVVRVIPKCTCLACSRELVLERVVWSNRALIYTDWAVSPAATLLEETVPVLKVSQVNNATTDSQKKKGVQCWCLSTWSCRLSH